MNNYFYDEKGVKKEGSTGGLDGPEGPTGFGAKTLKMDNWISLHNKGHYSIEAGVKNGLVYHITVRDDRGLSWQLTELCEHFENQEFLFELRQMIYTLLKYVEE